MSKQLPYFERVPEEERPGIKIQERDKKILEAVLKHRFISSAQLKALFWWIPERVIQKRLVKMYQNEILNRPNDQKVLRIRDGFHQLIYSLDNKGVTLLANHLGIDRKKIKWQVNSSANSSYLYHSLMVSKFRIVLTLATESPEERASKRLEAWANKYKAKNGKSPSLKVINEKKEELTKEEENRKQDILYRFYEKGLDANVTLDDWRKGKQVANKSFYKKGNNRREEFPICPDGYFVLDFANKERDDHWFLEADRGTESGPRFKKKLKTYLNFSESKTGRKMRNKQNIPDDFRVLTVTEDENRTNRLIEVAKELSIKGKKLESFWFGVESSYQLSEPTSIFERNFRTPRGEKKKSLLPKG